MLHFLALNNAKNNTKCKTAIYIFYMNKVLLIYMKGACRPETHEEDKAQTIGKAKVRKVK